ncbi:MAG: hypothetical protein ACTHOP_12580 [Mesorhizobium sp.]
MFDRDRRDRNALLALAIAMAAIVIISFFGFIEQSQRKYDKEKGSVEYKGEYNPWQDSWPQWSMAVFSGFATLASIWALFFLKGTLDRMAEANQIMAEDRRPWIGISLVPFDKGIDFEGDRLAIKFMLKLHNYGRSPAKDVVVSYQFHVLDSRSPPPVIDKLNQMRGRYVILPDGSETIYLKYTKLLTEINQVSTIRNGNYKPIIIISVSYAYRNTKEEMQLCETRSAFGIYRKNEDGLPPLNIRDGALSGGSIHINPEGGGRAT